MIPYLRETGFRLRLRFDWKGHGLGKAVELAKWTVLFVLANQAGALVVTQLATAAGKAVTQVDGTGFAAYANAQLIWGLPQAIITVSLMAALLPRISRSAADGRRRRRPRRHLPGPAHHGGRDRARSPSASSRSASRCAR